jgi:uncharacterized ferritin-like protein (DUF455 family)
LSGRTLQVPLQPGRDVEVLPIRQLPAKKGLSSLDGQARLLHDLASIELQAMELGLRTLSECPDAPMEFRSELAQITHDEGRHLRLCLEGLESLGRPWGSFPVHTSIWASVMSTDDLLDRIVIVHRYLEGSGLDATHSILNRLKGVNAPVVAKAVSIIAEDEMGHVQFGSKWFQNICKLDGLDSEEEFSKRLAKASDRLPRRLENIKREIRLQAGFSEFEIKHLEQMREKLL